MRKPGSKGAPTKQNFIDAREQTEEGGAGDIGTPKLTNKYKKVTPGQVAEFLKMYSEINKKK